MENEVTVVRIYISEADQGPHKNLMQEILTLLRDKHRLTQVTVFRGIAGTGERGETRAADVLRILVDLPLVVEFFDKPAIVEAVLPLLKQMLPSNRILSWKATIR
jgi:PII-like signaling protein